MAKLVGAALLLPTEWRAYCPEKSPGSIYLAHDNIV